MFDFRIDGTTGLVRTSGGYAELDSFAFAIAKAISKVVPERIAERGDVAGQPVPARAMANGRLYFRTGGLLRSAVAVPIGTTGGRAIFGGSSRGVKGMVRNAVKAATIRKVHGVNLFALKQEEMEGIARGLVGAISRVIAANVPGVHWSTPLPTGDLVDVLANAMRGRA